MTKEKETLVDTIWKKIKNNRLLAILIVTGTVLICMASFSESIAKFFKIINDIIPHSQSTNVIDVVTIKPSSSSMSYFDKNFQISKTGESDIVDLSKNDVIIDFSLNNKDGNLKYILKKEKNRFTINPNNDYLLLLQTSGIIKPRREFHRLYDFQFPTLDFKVINNSDKTIFFTKAVISVAASKPDSFPVLIMDEGYVMGFQISNIGWGKVYNCSMRFNLVTIDKPSDFNSGFKYEMNIQDFINNSRAINLSTFFETLGVNTDIASKLNCERDSNEVFTYNGHIENTSDIRGPFKNGVAKMYGEIIYEGINTAGKLKKDKLRFENNIYLGYFDKVGSAVGPSYIYDLMLESNKTNYKKEIQLSQSIKPNEFDRFDIKIAAPISSRHQFDITLFYNDNREFTLRNLSLNYFMSRSDSFLIKNKEDDISYIISQMNKKYLISRTKK